MKAFIKLTDDKTAIDYCDSNLVKLSSLIILNDFLNSSLIYIFLR